MGKRVAAYDQPDMIDINLRARRVFVEIGNSASGGSSSQTGTSCAFYEQDQCFRWIRRQLVAKSP